MSNTPGDTITFAFTGDSIGLYRRLDVDGGAVTIAVTRGQIPAVLDHLGALQHTIVLTVGGQMPAGSTGLNVYLYAFEAPVPAAFGPTAAQQNANYYRNLVGLPPAQISAAMDLAAQARADYLANAGLGGHDETAGTPGFVGAGPSDRITYFGYDAGSSQPSSQPIAASSAK